MCNPKALRFLYKLVWYLSPSTMDYCLNGFFSRKHLLSITVEPLPVLSFTNFHQIFNVREFLKRKLTLRNGKLVFKHWFPKLKIQTDRQTKYLIKGTFNTKYVLIPGCFRPIRHCSIVSFKILNFIYISRLPEKELFKLKRYQDTYTMIKNSLWYSR